MNQKQYVAETQTLFDEWEQRHGEVSVKKKEKEIPFLIDHTKGFIRDGVVCPEKWFEQSMRPLYLLKEAYGEGHWDLIADHLRQPNKIGKSQMWRRVSEWTYGLFATTESMIAPYGNWNPVENYDNEYLQQIAVVNIKKSGGKRGSDMDNIWAFAKFDQKYLYRQLELCDPTVIVCGYTASMLDILFDAKIRETENQNCFYHVVLNDHDVLVLDYWHPANHYPAVMNYYGLMAIYQQALLAGNGEKS